MEKKKNIAFEEAGRKLPFTVPENYFEQFAANIDSKIARKHVTVFTMIKPWMYVAAILFGVLFISRVGYNIYNNQRITNSENYELYVMSQVGEYEVVDLYLGGENK